MYTHLDDKNFKFIGYDYSHSGGDFYSVVYNDICTGRIEEFKKIKLNDYGLFSNISEVFDFINKREELKNIYPKYMFELGNFIVLKLWQYIGKTP